MFFVKYQFIWPSGFRENDFFLFRPIINKNRPWPPYLVTDQDETRKLYKRPHIDTSCKILVHLAQRFQRRRFFFISANQKQESPMAAIFVNRSRRNEETLYRTSHRCFLSNISSFGHAVSEKKIFLFQPIRNKNRPQWPCLLTDRDEMRKLYKGPYIEASCQVWFHLAQWFQRRRLKCEKFTDGRTDDGRQVMTKAHMAFGQVS